MKTYIALLRGVNVGGKNLLPMKDLAAILEELGSTNVQTYIQSGNVVFRNKATGAARLSQTIAAEIERAHGFLPHVLLLSPAELQRAIAANPFPEADSEPKSLHLFFTDAAPAKPDLKTLQALKSKSERFRLVGRVFYLHAPEGIGRSKLAARVEKALGAAATARNWRTVRKIAEMAAACG